MTNHLQDWFHESCLNLRKREISDGPKVEGDGKPQTEAGGPDDEEDEEADCLIPSETYDSLVCGACVRKHPLLTRKAGTPGWMIIEPDPVTGEMKVTGRSGDEPRPAAKEEVKEDGAPAADIKSQKREAEDGDIDRPGKKVKVEEESQPMDLQAGDVEPASESAKLKGHGDVFLAEGVRERLKAELDVSASKPRTAYRLTLFSRPRSPACRSHWKTRRSTSLHGMILQVCPVRPFCALNLAD